MMMKEIMIAGPAYCAAARPVSTKIPVPMMQPMPNRTRLRAPSERFSSPCSSSTLDLRNGLALEHPPEAKAPARNTCHWLPFSPAPPVVAESIDANRLAAVRQ